MSKISTIVLLLVALSIVNASSWVRPELRETKDLEAAELVPFIKNQKRSLVFFWETWCPFSQRALPHFEQFGFDQKDQIATALFDCGKDSSLCRSFLVNDYPRVVLFEGNRQMFLSTHGKTLDNRLNDFVFTESVRDWDQSTLSAPLN